MLTVDPHPGGVTMISFDEALRRVLTIARRLPAEPVALEACCGRVLAEDAQSDMDLPPFRKSAMDGYACRRTDLPGPLRVLESIAAGRMPAHAIETTTCSKIMTGAPLPNGADCVIMLEDTATGDDGRIRFTGRQTADNFCDQGEDAQAGDVVMRSGDMLGPAEVGVLATVGCVAPRVSRQPRVAIIATGSELCAAAERPSGAGIRDSNSHQLAAQICRIGAQVTRIGVVHDDETLITDSINRLRSSHDVLVLSGGVSTGDFDFVPGVLRRLGFELAFDSVAMQPGRPTIFGDDGSSYVCGLPGNPVSTFVVCELLLRPFLLALQGHVFKPRWVAARLATPIRRKRSARQLAVPVRFVTPETVEPVEYHGSAHIHAYTKADGFLLSPIGVSEILQGAAVHVRLF
ncbi:MAG: gephyrin-like molybdotransferase Glp [Planctomycetota bacterium]